jgi:hypothetical protein
MNCQMNATASGLSTTGAKKAARRALRLRTVRCRASASARPMAFATTTNAAVNSRVCQSASRASGVWAISLKFARPTQLAAALMPFQSVNAYQAPATKAT